MSARFHLVLSALMIAVTASAQPRPLSGGIGWGSYPVTFNVQWPTNAAETNRFWFTNNIYHCLVYSNDGSFEVGNTNKPRTEMRFEPDYTNPPIGEIQYQSMEMAPSNENSYCIFQIHTGDAESDAFGSTTFMFFWFTNNNGSVWDYSGTELVENLGNKWFQVNVDHNLVNHTVKAWINQQLIWTQQDNGAGDFYFKDGAYEQDHNPTLEMDTYITNILMWTNSGSPIVPLTWTGQTNGANAGSWDIENTTNWVNSTNGAIQFYQDAGTVTFNNSDPPGQASEPFVLGSSPVTFDDSAPGATTVNLQALLQPASVTVSNDVKTYAFAGSGSLGGSLDLVKYGGGTLMVDTTNSFTGGVIICGGTLQAGSAAALGATNVSITVSNGATLDDGGQVLTGYTNIVVSGAGVNGAGAIVNSGAAQTSAFGHLTLAGNTTFGGTNRWDLRLTGGSLLTGGQPYSITKVGTNQVSLVHALNIDPALSNIVVQAGIFAVQEIGANGLGANGAVTVFSNATLEVDYGETLTNLAKPFILLDGAALLSANGVNIIDDPVTLSTNAAGGAGNCTFNITGVSATLSNLVSGPGNLIKIGATNLILTATNLYSGNTVVSNGVVALAGGGSISDSATLLVASGATLDAGGRSDGTLTLAGGQKLTGAGTVKGNVIVGNDATLAPGGSLSTLVCNSNLTLTSGSATAAELSASPITNDLAQVARALVYGGTLILTNVSATALAAGDSFKLFSAANYSGTFAKISPAIPGINLAWNTNNLGSGVVSVVSSPTPPPVFGAPRFSGSNLIISGSDGVPDWIYYVLMTTNLTLPLAQWAVISTNTFDAGGNFILTNSAASSPSGNFYLLKLQ